MTVATAAAAAVLLVFICFHCFVNLADEASPAAVLLHTDTHALALQCTIELVDLNSDQSSSLITFDSSELLSDLIPSVANAHTCTQLIKKLCLARHRQCVVRIIIIISTTHPPFTICPSSAPQSTTTAHTSHSIRFHIQFTGALSLFLSPSL